MKTHPLEHLVTVFMALGLGLSYIAQKPLVFDVLPQWVGYILVAGATIFVLFDIRALVIYFKNKVMRKD